MDYQTLTAPDFFSEAFCLLLRERSLHFDAFSVMWLRAHQFSIPSTLFFNSSWFTLILISNCFCTLFYADLNLCAYFICILSCAFNLCAPMCNLLCRSQTVFVNSFNFSWLILSFGLLFLISCHLFVFSQKRIRGLICHLDYDIETCRVDMRG